MEKLITTSPQTAYQFSFELIQSRKELDTVLEFFVKDKLLTTYEIVHLERPNSTYRQRFIVIRDILDRNPLLLDNPRYKTIPWLETLKEFINIEKNLKLSLCNKTIIQEIIDKGNTDIGKVQKVEPILRSGSINFPIKIISDTGKFFLRYTSALGGECFLRYDPKETIFRHVLGEQTFQKLIGPDATTVTIYPSIIAAFTNLQSRELETTVDRLLQRIIIQPFYADEYFRVQDYNENRKNLIWMIKNFARINALIHSSTVGINSVLEYKDEQKFSLPIQNHIKTNQHFYRYSTSNLYEDWLKKINWVTHMVKSFDRSNIRDFPKTNIRIIDHYERTRKEFYKENIDIEEIWWETIETSLTFWKQGSILTGPDIKPSNSFYRKTDGHIRLYDFDYFAFFDAAYHLGQSMYTVLRFSFTIEGLTNPDILIELSEFFINEYLQNLEINFTQLTQTIPGQFKQIEFLNQVYKVAIISFFYTMMHDICERELTPAQISSLKILTKWVLKKHV